MTSAVGLSVTTLSVTTVSISASRPSCGTCKTAPAGFTRDRADISGPGKTFAGLRQLASQDPAEFKRVASDIADKLKSVAEGSGGAAGAFLSALAEKFSTAAETGDATGLQPAGGGGRPHFRGGASGYTPQGKSAAGGGLDLRSLFESVARVVDDALSGVGTSSVRA